MWRTLVSLFALLILLALLLVAGGWYYATAPLRLPAETVDVTIPPGLGMKRIAAEVVAAGVPVQAEALVWLARLSGRDSQIKAGSYAFATGLSPWDLVNKLSRGDVTQAELVVPEGWNLRQLRAALDRHPDLRHDSRGLSEPELLTRLGISAPGGELRGEGLFFPDTYLFAKQSSDLDVLRRAHKSLQRELALAWEQRQPGLPLASPYQALTLASIVEKETGKAADRDKIASVFINRLRSGMRLQTDPTVIYGLGASFDGNLRKIDLLTDTPYNTYTRGGLPPTPIALPGRAALRAAVQPAQSSYLYFVARGDGSSAFSRSLDEHNRAVARYQLGRQ